MSRPSVVFGIIFNCLTDRWVTTTVFSAIRVSGLEKKKKETKQIKGDEEKK